MSEKNSPLVDNSLAYLHFLEDWIAKLPALPIDEAITDPARAAIVSVDVINGFCYEGPLSSPRVAGIVEPIARLFERAWEHGVRHILLTQDTHEPAAVEFGQFPPHCVRGTSEAETVGAFKALPFFDRMVVMEKNSIASGLDTELEAWLSDHPEVDTFIVVGDCTDLCTYQLAMYLRLDANARQLERRVIVPEDCVQTYDFPVDAALQAGAVPHPGDLYHHVFLHHMQLNGVEICASVG
jgi:nicotinamidase-related amidase